MKLAIRFFFVGLMTAEGKAGPRRIARWPFAGELGDLQQSQLFGFRRNEINHWFRWTLQFHNTT